MDAVESLKEKLVLACKVLQRQGVVDVYGHVSARLPGERILSTPHMPPGKVALRDLIIIDLMLSPRWGVLADASERRSK